MLILMIDLSSRKVVIKIRFYLSHSIRGKHGKDATNAQMKENSDKAILIANLIRNAIPSIDVYCPGEHEDFVLTAYQKLYLTENEILDVDCAIIDGCDGVIIYVPKGDELQGGRKVEAEYAVAHSIQVFVFATVDDVILRLAHYILRS